MTRRTLSTGVATAVIYGLCAVISVPSVLGRVSGRAGEPECDYYASPTGVGSNDGSTAERPFRPQDFWRRAQPGKTLCRMDGVYRDDAFMLDPHRQGQTAPLA